MFSAGLLPSKDALTQDNDIKVPDYMHKEVAATEMKISKLKHDWGLVQKGDMSNAVDENNANETLNAAFKLAANFEAMVNIANGK